MQGLLQGPNERQCRSTVESALQARAQRRSIGLSLLLALLLSACGGHRADRVGLDAPGGPGPAPQMLAGLPAPGDLPSERLVTYTLGDIQRKGSEYEAALPAGNVSVDGSDLQFSSSPGAALSSSAYAIYAFHLEGYDREPLLELSFATPPADNSHLWLGISDWDHGRWSWQTYDGSGMLNLTDLAPYTSAAPDYLLYLCVLCTGGESCSLSQVQLGTNLPPDSIYVVPEKGTADPGEHVLVTVWTSGTLNHFYDLPAVRVVVPEFNSYVPGSLNAGAPGGAATAADGAWTILNPGSLNLVPDAQIVPVDLGNGLIAYDFYIHPVGGAELPSAIGPLFNFELAVYTDVDFTFQRTDGGAVDRTYYKDKSGGAHFFTSDDNAGGTGISLSGNALPSADLQADTVAGPLDLTVNFNASGSSDVIPGSVVQYEFDYGDGGGFVDNGANPAASHTYTSAGAFSATLRVTDNEGGQDSATITIYAGYFDEVEDNDDLGPSQDLPALPVFDFLGSIGPQGVYDGDNEDWYKVTAPANKHLVCHLSEDTPASNIKVELAQGRSNLAWSVPDGNGGQILDYLVKDTDVQPLRVIVHSLGADFPSSNYHLDVQVNPPTAVLTANPPLGPLPLDVTLDASGSSDSGGSIVKYEFDNGEGGGFVDNGSTPTLLHTYETAGVFTARVRVTDDEGNIATASAIVAPGLEYDEVENNDSVPTANTIASLPVTGFKGSIGARTGYISYDGDSSDFYSFAATSGDSIQISCSFNPADCQLNLLLYNKNGVFLDQSAADGKSPQTIVHTVASGESPLKLLVSQATGGGDYSLDIKLNPPLADLQADVTEGEPPLTVNFDASASSDKAPGMIVKYEFDFGKGGGWEDYGTTSTAMASYDSDGTYAAKLRVTDDDGLQDTAQVSIKVGNPYNEVEDNDDHSQANTISFPLLNWAASLGDSAPLYVGYDGDDRDFVKFTATAGQVLSFDTNGDSDTADIDIHLENEAGDTLAESTSPEASEHIDYTFTADGTYYIYLELWYQTTQDGFSDYICSGTLN